VEWRLFRTQGGPGGRKGGGRGKKGGRREWGSLSLPRFDFAPRRTRKRRGEKKERGGGQLGDEGCSQKVNWPTTWRIPVLREGKRKGGEGKKGNPCDQSFTIFSRLNLVNSIAVSEEKKKGGREKKKKGEKKMVTGHGYNVFFGKSRLSNLAAPAKSWERKKGGGRGWERKASKRLKQRSAAAIV